MNVRPQRCLTLAFLASGAAAVALFVGWRMLPGNRLGVRINQLLASPSAGSFLNYRLPPQAWHEFRTMGTNAIPWLLRSLDQASGKPRLYGLVMGPRIPKWVRSRYVNYLDSRHDRARAVADAFGALGPAASQAIPELLWRVGRPRTAQNAAYRLLEIRPPPTTVVTNLLVYLQSTNAQVRSAASTALICIDGSTATRVGLQ